MGRMTVIPIITTSFLHTTCVMGSKQDANWNMVFDFLIHIIMLVVQQFFRQALRLNVKNEYLLF